ncbi:hypothetical protein [Leifsonia sp. NPDC080035]|uniref:Flp pilus-assembly TadG-like N-terminal domain-containing protein n=1 Tax=Leifsonia sp. NPDC080035 TaxID=3143936 RepID=A0AAU7GBG2_9MICO
MMRSVNAWFRAIREGREDGMALITVVIFGTVLVMLVATAAAFAGSGAMKSRTDDDWNAAMAAAYAGLEDYKARLANDNTYVQYRNPDAPFSATSTGALPPTTNRALLLGTGPDKWAQVPSGDPDKPSRAYYRYEVDNSQYSTTGVVRLRSTGMVGTEIRSIVVNVRQTGFIDFLYFTDFEVKDPSQSNSACATSTGKPNYAWYYSTNTHASACTEIQFGANDTINGPLHSNDTLLICGSTFNGPVTTSNPKTPFFTKVDGCADPIFNKGTPTLDATIGMPQTNSQMKTETRLDVDSVKRPGCLYTGPTIITFTSDGNMNVKSPFTSVTQIKGDPAGAGSGTPAMCGTPGNVANGLGSPGGATIPVIPQNLIYVQDVPSVPTTTDKNGWPSGTWPTGFTCTNSPTTGSGFTFGTAAFPMANEDVPTASPSHYGCRKGDVYVQGTVHGQITVAAQDYVYITGDLLYQDSTKDILGLVGNNAVWVWNPFNGSTPLLGKNRTIYAAILSVAHTFMVQNYDKGTAKRGTLNVYGAIAQEYRGTVGTAGSPGTGYDKNYNYDPRFKYTAPPKFLSPVSTSYGVSTLVEVPKAFTPDGSAAG